MESTAKVIVALVLVMGLLGTGTFASNSNIVTATTDNSYLITELPINQQFSDANSINPFKFMSIFDGSGTGTIEDSTQSVKMTGRNVWIATRTATVQQTVNCTFVWSAVSGSMFINEAWNLEASDYNATHKNGLTAMIVFQHGSVTYSNGTHLVEIGGAFDPYAITWNVVNFVVDYDNKLILSLTINSETWATNLPISYEPCGQSVPFWQIQHYHGLYSTSKIRSIEAYSI